LQLAGPRTLLQPADRTALCVPWILRRGSDKNDAVLNKNSRGGRGSLPMSSPEIAALSSRDRHLFGPGPKRMLSLDGGGVRGAISIAFLERLEKLIEEVEGRPTLLSDWFDFIGGTSTGAIIAGALALGFRAADVRKFYHTLGPKVFRRSFWRIAALCRNSTGKT
jgi:hypothetical protein